MNKKIIRLSSNALTDLNNTFLDTPTFAEIRKGDIILWGYDNTFPDYLIQLMEKSSRHKRCIKFKTDLVGGNGFDRTSINQDTISFIENSFGDENLDDILKKVSYDFELFGGFALKLFRNQVSDKVVKVEYIDIYDLRISENKDCVYYSKDWRRRGSNANAIKYELFKEDSTTGVSVLLCAPHQKGARYYPKPDYLTGTGINYIELDYQISEFQASSIENGFSPGLILTLPEVASDEEREYVVKQLRDSYATARNANKPMVIFDNPDSRTEITQINSDSNDNRFLQVLETIQDGIFQTHRINNPQLVGQMIPGKLGTSNEEIESLKIFQAQYVDPQQYYIERCFNKITKYNNLDPLKITKYKIDLDVDVNVNDILSILQAPLSNNQKIEILKLLGYREDQVKILVENNPE
jgi:hypothetical protein